MPFPFPFQNFPRHFHYPLVAFCSAILTVLWGMHLTHAATLTRWEFDPETNQVIFTLEEKTTPTVFLLEDPPRIVVDFPDTQIAEVIPPENYPGAVREIRASQFTQETARVVLELTPDTRLSPQAVELSSLSGNRWLLRPQLAPRSSTSNTDFPLPPPQPPLAQGETTVRVPSLPQQISKPRQTPTIQFGQPLPTQNPVNANATSEPSEGIITRGTTLKLRFAGEKSLYLQPEQVVQEVLFVAQPIRNSNQTITIPVGTPVIGRFESNEQGSFFLTQAIILENRKIPIQARSPLLDSLFSINPLPRRDHSVNLPPSVSTSSRVVIEPNAVLPVQLSEDLQY